MRIDGIILLWFLLTATRKTGQSPDSVRFARHTTDSKGLKGRS